MKLTIDDDEWRGVPVFIRTGKALSSKITEINMVFSGDSPDGRRNVLTLRIHRITSYNVCYTKLLRSKNFPGESPQWTKEFPTRSDNKSVG